MKIVVPYRSHEMVRTLVEDCGLKPDVLIVLVPGIRGEIFLEPAPEVTDEDIPRILGTPSHLVYVSPEGEADHCVMQRGDAIFLLKDTPSFMVVAAASLAAQIDPGLFCLVEGRTITTIARDQSRGSGASCATPLLRAQEEFSLYLRRGRGNAGTEGCPFLCTPPCRAFGGRERNVMTVEYRCDCETCAMPCNILHSLMGCDVPMELLTHCGEYCTDVPDGGMSMRSGEESLEDRDAHTEDLRAVVGGEIEVWECIWCDTGGFGIEEREELSDTLHGPLGNSVWEFWHELLRELYDDGVREDVLGEVLKLHVLAHRCLCHLHGFHTRYSSTPYRNIE